MLMKRFTFLSKSVEFNGISLREEIVDKIYAFCREYHDFIEACRSEYLNDNPNVNPLGQYEYPIPHHNIYHHFQEGKLWHSGTDYDEELDLLSHYLFLDSYNHSEDYFIEVEETDGQEYTIYNISLDNSRHE